MSDTVGSSQQDGRWDTGTTRALRHRAATHADGRVWSTRSRRPVQLLDCEVRRQWDDTLRRERYLRQRVGAGLVALSRNQLARH